jgi:hypothetical protein
MSSENRTFHLLGGTIGRPVARHGRKWLRMNFHGNGIFGNLTRTQILSLTRATLPETLCTIGLIDFVPDAMISPRIEF